MLLVAFRAGDLYLSSDISSFSGCISYSYCNPASTYVTMKNKNTCKVAQMRCVVISHRIWGQKWANVFVLSTSGSPAGQTRRPHTCLHLLVTGGTAPPGSDTTDRFSLLNMILSEMKMVLPFESCWFINVNFCSYFYSCLELNFTGTLTFCFLYKRIATTRCFHIWNTLLLFLYMDVFLDGDVGELSVWKKTHRLTAKSIKTPKKI